MASPQRPLTNKQKITYDSVSIYQLNKKIMKERRVILEDRQRRKIVGDLIIPDGKTPYPAVIVIHGFKGNRNQPHIKAIAEGLVAGGIATLRVDLTREPGESSLPFLDMTVTDEIEELSATVNFIRKQSEADPSRVGLTGHSLGGYVIMNYTAHNEEKIRSVAPLSAVFNFSGSFKRIFNKTKEEVLKDFKEKGRTKVWSRSRQKEFLIKKSFYEDSLFHDAKDFVSKITCPILVLHGDKDESVSISHAKKYFNGVSSKIKKLEIIEGADHDYTNPTYLSQVVEKVVYWFRNTLK